MIFGSSNRCSELMILLFPELKFGASQVLETSKINFFFKKLFANKVRRILEPCIDSRLPTPASGLVQNAFFPLISVPQSIPFSIAGTPSVIHLGAGAPFR